MAGRTCRLSSEEETIKVQRTQEESYLNGEKLGLSKIELILNKLRIDAGPGTEKREFLSDEDLERIEVREVPIGSRGDIS